MSYSTFQELCGACYISRRDIEEEYNTNMNKPWFSRDFDYTEDKRSNDVNKFLDELFQNDKELDLEQLSSGISRFKEKIKEVRGPIWSTIGNVSAAIARAASESFKKYCELLPERPDIDLEEILKQIKPSPYGNMQFPNFIEKPDGGFATKGTHPADYEAICMMYDGNLLALLIAREYDFEQYMP